MRMGLAAVAETDWSRLFHAYGVASNTPGHLRALVGEEEKARAEAVGHLRGAVIHQGTPWSVTPPAALVVAGLLSDPRTARPCRNPVSASAGAEPAPLRVILLDFLQEVAEATQPEVPEDEIRAAADQEGREEEVAATLEALLDEDEDAWGEELVDVIMAQVVLDLRAVAPLLVDPVAGCLDDDDPRVRSRAIETLAALAVVPGAVARPAELAARLERAAPTGSAREHRGS